MNPLNKLLVQAKIRGVVALILKQYPRDFIADEPRRVVRIARSHEEVGIEALLHYSELQEAEVTDLGLDAFAAPEVEGVGEVAIFGTGFLVFAIGGVEEAFGPGVAVEEVEGAELGEEGITGRGGVGGVPDKGVDPSAVGGNPGDCAVEGAFEVGDYGGGVDEVSL